MTALACAAILGAPDWGTVQSARDWRLPSAEAKASKHSGKKTAAAKSRHKSRKETAAPARLPAAQPDSSAATNFSSEEAHSGALVPVSTAPPAAPTTSEGDIALVRKAIDTVHSGGTAKATQIEAAMSDPAARKLVEWIILRHPNNGVESTRYMAFIAANPRWPSSGMFRRRAEEMLWVEQPKPTSVLAFFKDSPPQTARGRLALARALLAQGDTQTAKSLVCAAWRNDSMSAELEKEALKNYSEFLGRADHKARMEKRLFAGDKESAIRAAHRLGPIDMAIARMRIALSGKGKNAAKLLDSLPAEAQQDPGYLFARVNVLRHQEKVAKAAEVMLSAPNDAAEIHDFGGMVG